MLRKARPKSKDAQVAALLKLLCARIDEPSRKPGPGRPRIPLRDAIFAAVMKVYSTLSGRKAARAVDAYVKQGYLGRDLHCSSVFRCLEDASTTEILSQLINSSVALRTGQAFVPVKILAKQPIARVNEVLAKALCCVLASLDKIPDIRRAERLVKLSGRVADLRAQVARAEQELDTMIGATR